MYYEWKMTKCQRSENKNNWGLPLRNINERERACKKK
jgi:hypothetical protein